MSNLLPWVFVALATLAFVGVFVSLWMSLRNVFTPGVDAFTASVSDTRRAMIAEKDALLQELQDLAFEHESGKISDADYETLNAKMRQRAKLVLASLDADVAPFRQEARQLIEAQLGESE